MTKIYGSLFILLSLISLRGYSQEFDEKKFSDLYDKARFELGENDFRKALKTLDELISLDPDNSNVEFYIGYSYLKGQINIIRAIQYLEKASMNLTKSYRMDDFKERKAPFLALKLLGDAYHQNYQFSAAIDSYTRFREELGEKSNEEREDINHRIQICKDAEILKKSPVNMTIKNLGKTINSISDDYAACLNADETVLVFTSRRAGTTGEYKASDGKYFEDIYWSHKLGGEWQKPEKISDSINTYSHEASVGLSADGQTLLIYKYDEFGGGDLHVSYLIGEEWTIPAKLGSNINTQYWEGHASISPDGNVLYFSSDRPGGKGGKDIYFSKKLPNGEWALAQNIGPEINSERNEDSPFIHPDGTTLFFSSTGHMNMGGYDVFFSEKIDEFRWSRPQNVGYPVNTPGNDIYFQPSTDGKRAYYSSFRNDGIGESDIYLIEFPENEETPLTVFKGVVKDASGNIPESLSITVTQTKTQSRIGYYTPNSKTGKYLIILPPGSSYNIEYEIEGEIVHNEQIDVPVGSEYQEISKAINLPELSLKKD